MSLESSFQFDGSSFNDECSKALVNVSAQNLEELLQAEPDEMDPESFLIKPGQQENDSNTSVMAGA